MTTETITQIAHGALEGVAQGFVSAIIAVALGVLIALVIGGDGETKARNADLASDIFISFGMFTALEWAFKRAMNLKDDDGKKNESGDAQVD